MTAIVIGSLVLVASMVALSFYLARWAKSSHASLVAGDRERQTLRQRVDELTGHVQDRDRAITTTTDELARERTARTAAQSQRDQALALVDVLAAKNPTAVAVAVRDKLKRLRALAAVPIEPAATPPAPGAAPEAG